jgi:hypothetical protein
VQEHKQLSDPEIFLCHDLKARFLSMTVVDKLRAKQKSRLASVRAEEANENSFSWTPMGEGGKTSSTRYRPLMASATCTMGEPRISTIISVHILALRTKEI